MRTFPVWSGLAVFTLPALLTVAHSAPSSHKTPLSSGRLTKAARIARQRQKAAEQAQISAQRRTLTALREQQAQERKPITIHANGTVLLPNGNKANDAHVYFCWRNNGGNVEFRRLTVDAEGRFAQNVTAKEVQNNAVGLVAYVPGQGMSLEVLSKSKASAPMTLKLQPGTTLTGRVVRPDGAPAANKDLYAAGMNMTSTATLSRAMFLSQNVNGLVDLSPEREVSAAAKREAEQRMMRLEFLQSADKLLPSLDLMNLIHAKTDSQGRFTLTNVPPQSQIRLALTGGLTLARGSRGAILIDSAQPQEAGILVATQKTNVPVHVINSATAKPAEGAQVTVVSQNLNAELSMMGGEDRDSLSWQEVANAQGNVVLHNMLPGDYRISVAGTVRDFHVSESGTTPVVISTRLGSLKGRVVDEKGKPVANLDISSNAAMKSQALLMGAMRQAQIGMQGENNAQVVARTGDDGAFEIPDFAWGADDVTVHTQRGNDFAIWNSASGKIGSRLTLTLRKNALVTVTGRLLDPHRHSVGKLTCQTLHWQATPRSEWFATAHQVQTDAQGHFRVTGLERGESFSIIATDQRNAGKQTLANFESPRFDTPPTGETQDLGDVTVHESDDSQDIQEIYGGGPMGEFTRSGAFQKLLPTPDVQEVVSAKVALLEYRRALASGDLDAVQRGMAQASSGWSSDRAAFLQQASLVSPAGTPSLAVESLQPLRFVPAVAAVFATQSVQSMMVNGVAPSALSEDGASDPNWMFFASDREGNGRIAAVLHKENGQWRVVAVPSQQAAMLNTMVLDAFTRRAPVSGSVGSSQPTVATLPAEQLDAARKVGTAYLQAWNEGRQDTMYSLTSSFSPNFTDNAANFKKMFEKRRDDGLCPINDEVPALQTLDGLTNAEQNRLTGFAVNMNADRINRSRFAQQRNNVIAVQSAVATQEAKADGNKAPAPIFATFQYETQGRKFLMLMSRTRDAWQVLEPALPM